MNQHITVDILKIHKLLLHVKKFYQSNKYIGHQVILNSIRLNNIVLKTVFTPSYRDDIRVV